MTKATKENAGEFVTSCLTVIYSGPYLMSFLTVGVPAVFGFAAAHTAKITIGSTLVILNALARGHEPIRAGVNDGADPLTTKLFVDYLRELVERFGGIPRF
jgi:hypothetical protein